MYTEREREREREQMEQVCQDMRRASKRVMASSLRAVLGAERHRFWSLMRFWVTEAMVDNPRPNPKQRFRSPLLESSHAVLTSQRSSLHSAPEPPKRPKPIKPSSKTHEYRGLNN